MKAPKRIPDRFDSDEEAGRFWDTHSSADYEDQMSEIKIDVDIRKRTFVPSSASERKKSKNKTKPVSRRA